MSNHNHAPHGPSAPHAPHEPTPATPPPAPKNISILGKYQEAQKNQNHQMPSGPTLTSILGDEKKSTLFGMMLERANDPNLVEISKRLMNGKLDQGDMAILEDHRQAYVQRMEDVKSVSESINEHSIAEYAANYQEFQNIVNLVGPKKAAEVIKGQLEKMRITDPFRFSGIKDAIDVLKEEKEGPYKDLDNRVKYICKKNGISESEYAEILADPDDHDRVRKLQTLVKEQYGGGKKIRNWLSRGRIARREADYLDSYKEDIDFALSSINQRIEDVGSELYSTIENNEDVRRAMSHEILGKNLPKEKYAGFSTLKSTIPNEVELEEEWDAYKTSKGLNAASWTALSDTEKNTRRDEFMKGMNKNRVEKMGGGFWVSVFKTIFTAFEKAKKASLN